MQKVKSVKKLNKNVDMLSGSIVKAIIVFAIPLLIGNLFQQFYNIVDTYVISKTDSNASYVAVGNVAPLLNMLIGAFSGFASGAGVIISHSFGEGNYEKVKKDTHTAAYLTILLGIVFTIIGLLLAPTMLKLMFKSDGDDIYNYALRYVMIYFSGIIFLLIYNMGSGILRAIGDSKRPFYFLVVATVINVALDFLFVLGFDMGVTGVALATITAQGVSAVLTVITLLTTKSVVRITPKDIKIDKSSLKGIIKIGLPSGLQMTLTAFSNMFVQSYIAGVEADKTACLGGWTTYSKIDQFIFLPIQSISLSLMTFVGQNLGNKNLKRAKKGTLYAYITAVITAVICILPVTIFAEYFAKIFKKDQPEILYYAELFLKTLTPFYICSTINQVLSASMRGAGNSKIPMILMLISFIGVRQIYLFIMANYVSNTPLPIAFSYPIGWIACSILTLTCFFIYNFGEKRVKKTKTQ